jgi:hypothetical protein
MAIKTVDEASRMLQVGIDEMLADMPDMESDEVATDMVSAVAWEIEDAAVLAEFCRVELGYIPVDTGRRLETLPGGKALIMASRRWLQ